MRLAEPSRRQRVITRLFWFVLTIPVAIVTAMNAHELGLWRLGTLLPAAITIVFLALASIVPARISCWFTGWIM